MVTFLVCLILSGLTVPLCIFLSFPAQDSELLSKEEISFANIAAGSLRLLVYPARWCGNCAIYVGPLIWSATLASAVGLTSYWSAKHKK